MRNTISLLRAIRNNLRSAKKSLKGATRGILQRVCPTLLYLREYGSAVKRSFEPNSLNRDKFFNEFIRTCRELKCLQIGVKENIGKKFGPNWTSVDLYDTREFIDYHYDITALKFADESFDAVVCHSILEHVAYPQKAIGELHRVLKVGGRIWVQLPFSFFYHPRPKDFWRASPDGLRIWMEDFDEIVCACHSWTGSSLTLSTYFYGKKRA